MKRKRIKIQKTTLMIFKAAVSNTNPTKGSDPTTSSITITATGF